MTVACSRESTEEREEESRSAGQAVVGGQPAADHPEVGLLAVSDGHEAALCTGTKVSCNAVLTAAHCVPPDGIGFFIMEDGGNYEIRDTWKFAPPAGADLTAPFDLGLVRVDQMSSMIAPAEMADGPGAAGAEASTYGYGCDDRFYETGAGARRKRDWSFDPDFVTDTGILCHGDSGGPTFVNGKVQSVSAAIRDEYQGCGPEGAIHKYDAWAIPWNPDFRSQAEDKINEWAPYCDHC
jgi:hypothetical protein